ncbi:Amino acid transporter transmembrane domain-containing protein [Pleurotus pulmonarius]
MADNPRSSEDSFYSSRSSLDASALDSSTALILVHDEDDDLSNNSPIEDTEDDQQFEVASRSSMASLRPSVVLLYLLSPLLKFGAMMLPNIGPPIKYTVPSIFIFAIATALAQQLWYMLSRHLRKYSVEDIVPEVFARGRGKERSREQWRRLSRFCAGALRLLLCILYFHAAVESVVPLVPKALIISPQLVITILFGAPLLPLTTPRSLSSLRTIAVTGLSILSYVAWFICVVVAHAHGTLETSYSWANLYKLWRPITTTAFVFACPNSLHLYSNMKGTTGRSKTSNYRSFSTLLLLSFGIAISLTLPLTFFSSRWRRSSTSLQPPPHTQAIDILQAITLLLAIPPLIITMPPLPAPDRLRHLTNVSVSKIVMVVVVIVSSTLPADVLSVIGQLTLVLALLSTYVLPAFLHIVVHNFKRPLSIIVPTHPSTPTALHQPSHSEPSSPILANDELLQRKERLLQKRQFRKRIIWDIIAWVLLVPLGGGGLTWTVGKLMKKW